MKETILSFILENSEDNYRQFSEKLIYSDYPINGIRMNKIKDFSKKMVKENPDIETYVPDTYEEVLIRGYIISYTKRDFKEYKKLAHSHLKYMDNWSSCDSFVSGSKWIKKYKKEYYKDILKYCSSDKNYYQRYGLVVLLSYYMEKEYLNDIFDVLRNSDYHEYYYSLMAAAWLLSYCFIFFFDETLNFVKDNKLHDFVYKKGIQKALESYRVSDNNKLILRSLRNSLN